VESEFPLQVIDTPEHGGAEEKEERDNESAKELKAKGKRTRPDLERFETIMI